MPILLNWTTGYRITLFISVICLAALTIRITTKTPDIYDSLTDVADDIERRFPSVTHISVAQLVPLLTAKQKSEGVLVLDSRTRDEYSVSHLPGALLYIDTPELKERIRRASASRLPIFIYCSVGYRSSELVERLQEDGLNSIYSLKGGIFEWANRGLPLETTDSKPAYKVHPFDSAWGKYIRPGLRAKDLKKLM